MAEILKQSEAVIKRADGRKKLLTAREKRSKIH